MTNPVKLVRPRRFGDDRGWFSETYNTEKFAKIGVDFAFVQDNQAFSGPAWVLRGMHFQGPPKAQDKLVRCTRGRIYDVAVDIRRGSPTYGKWVGAELTAANGLQLLAPAGFLHGYLTLEPDTEVEYKVTNPWAPDCEGGVIWNDPDIGIEWPLQGQQPVLSDKDVKMPRLAEIESPFVYSGDPLEPLTAEPLVP